MPRHYHRPPKYCLHKGTKQATVSINGQRIYLGPYGSPQSHIKYQQVLKQWQEKRDQEQQCRLLVRTVIDASTLLAYLQDEKGAEQAKQYCMDAAISTVNLSEVFQKAMRQGSYPIVQAIIQQVAIEVIPFSEKHAAMTAELHEPTIGKHISIADRACMAPGKLMQLPVVTGDHAWQGIDVGVEFVFFRSMGN